MWPLLKWHAKINCQMVRPSGVLIVTSRIFSVVCAVHGKKEIPNLKKKLIALMIIITDRMYHSAIEIASKAPEDMHKLSERIVKRTCRGRFRYLNLHQFLEVENDQNRINCDYPPLASSLAKYFSWNHEKLYKTWNEVYCSVAPDEKNGNSTNLSFDSQASWLACFGCYHTLELCRLCNAGKKLF